MDMEDDIRQRTSGVNVPRTERLASAAIGAAVAYLGARRGGLLGWLAAAGGAALVGRGVTGRCPMYRTRALGAGVQVRRAVTILRPRPEVYAFWRNLENLPRFMAHVQRVTVLDDRRSRWLVQEGPLTLEWTAEITEDIPDRRIAWSALPDATVVNAGVVELRDAPGGRGTEVHVALRYRPPGGAFVAAPLRGLLRKVTQVQVQSELRRLRQLLQTGEIATGATRPSELDPHEREAMQLAWNAPPRPAHALPNAETPTGPMFPTPQGGY
jgi:uncharacterized membrane protein